MAAGDVKAGITKNSGKACAVFDGADDILEVSSRMGLDNTYGFTISFWIKSDRADANQVVTSKTAAGTFGGAEGGRGWYMRVNAAGTGLQTVVGNGAGGFANCQSGNNLFALNTWYHVAFTCSPGAESQYYQNGAAFGAATAIATINVDDVDLFQLGNNTDGFAFKGKLADVRLWRRVLTAAEVLAIYNGANNSTKLESRYRFSGDFNDELGNNNLSAGATGTYRTIIDGVIAAAIAAQRVGASDKWLLCDSPAGLSQAVHVEIEE